MKTCITLIVASLIAMPALATEKKKPVKPARPVTSVSAPQTQTQSLSVTAPQTLSVPQSYQSVPDSYTIRQAPAAPDVLASPTAPCRVAVGVSGSAIAGSLGITGSSLDEGCDAREDARLLWNMGLPEVAIMRLCAKSEIAVALKESSGFSCPKEVVAPRIEAPTIQP